MNRYCRSSLCMVACAIVLAAAPIRAAELDKFLPDETQIIVSVNVRQMLESGLAKKYEIAKEVEKQINQNDEATKVLKSLGLDPLKDINRIIVALPGKKDEKRMLVAIQGSFDLAKIHDAADQHIKAHPDKLAVTKEGGQRLYEVKDQKGDKTETTFVTFLNKDVIVASPIKDYVMDAMAKSSGKKEAKFAKGLQQLVAKQDAAELRDRALATDDMKAELANILQTKQVSKNLESIAGLAPTDVKLNEPQTSDEATAKDGWLGSAASARTRRGHG